MFLIKIIYIIVDLKEGKLKTDILSSWQRFFSRHFILYLVLILFNNVRIRTDVQELDL